MPEDDLVFVLEHRPVEPELAEQQHGMVLEELDQRLVLAEQPVRLAFAQRASPWRVPPVS